MKAIRMLSVAGLVLSGLMASYAQTVASEVPGDNFSLEGALELFKKSSSPEEFEKMLNSPDAKVNNLDLNGDGYIDYIRVHDRYERNVHAFILQAVISEREMQDIAVIELEKLSNGKAVLQIIGDEDIYGIETIIEPTREVRTYAGTQSSRTVVNVWTWPSVQYVYSPYYTGWVSPWGWYRRPIWWHTWTPVAYVHYHPIWRPYYPHYAVCHTRRVVYAHHIYHPHRVTSVVVRDRHRDQLVRYRNDDRVRTRYEERRNYAQDTRARETPDVRERRPATSGLDRRTAPQREISSSRDRGERDQTVRNDLQSRPVDLRRADVPERRTTTPSPTRVLKQEPSPAVNRARSSEDTRLQQRPAGTLRTAPSEVQRPSELRRQAPPSRPSAVEHRTQSAPARTSSVERRATTPASVERRSDPRPSPSPTVERRSSSRPADGGTRTARPERIRRAGMRAI